MTDFAMDGLSAAEVTARQASRGAERREAPDTKLPCLLCPRACAAARTPWSGRGFCGMGTFPLVARAAVHLWEEPCISGSRGTGAVFFSGCTLKCAYCQNMEISHGNKGTRLSVSELAECFRRLEAQGVHSLSLITATHFLPAVLEALELHCPRIPVVCNSGGYETQESIDALKDVVDVWLPDLKNFSPRLSGLLLGAEDYFAVASRAVKQMCRLSGPPQYDAEGIMTRGTLVRHLIIPGCTADSIRVLRFIRDELPDGTPVSLMRQYSPVPGCRVPGIDRKLSDREYARVLEAFHALGLTGYSQEAESAGLSYTPSFDGTGL